MLAYELRQPPLADAPDFGAGKLHRIIERRCQQHQPEVPITYIRPIDGIGGDR